MNILPIDAEFARLELEKRLALIKAWEESEKTKADNKYGFFDLFLPIYFFIFNRKFSIFLISLKQNMI